MAYNSSSASDRLSAVRDAIAACLKNQSYRIGDKTFTKADLKTLYAMEARLEKKVAIANRTSPRTARANFGGMF